MAPQGGQWRGMGTALLRDPVAGDLLRRCDARLGKLGGWSLLEELTRTSAGPRSHEADVVQPLIVCLQMAMAERLLRWGIEPDEIVGHSLGEISAAWAAGVLTLDDAVTLIFHYSRLQTTTAGNGGMAVVEATPEELAPLVAREGGRVVIAGRNGLTSTILSGEPRALDRIVSEIRSRDVFGARIDVNVAAHSPQIDPIMGDLRASLAEIRPRAATRPLWSTVTGAPLAGPECDGAYWARNLREPVRFGEVIERWSEGEPPLFVELSPHPILGHAMNGTLSRLGRKGAVLAAGRRGEPEDRTLRDLARELWTLGASVDPEAVLPDARTAEKAAPCILPLSAHSPEALEARARDVTDFLRRDDAPGLSHVIYTASVRR
jgi:polyketide synthase 12/myxalamid-type polyketide synthase MxaF